MKTALSVLALVAIAGTANADVISWNFGTSIVANGGSVGASTGTTAGLASTPTITRNNGGSNNFIETNSVSNLPGTSAGGNLGAAAPSGTINTNSSANFQWTITPVAYTSLQITNIAFGSRSTGTGPTALSLRSSANSYATNLFSSTATANSAWAAQGGAASQTITSATSYRLYGSGGTGSSSANNWRVDDLAITYSVLDSAINASTPINAGTVRTGGSVGATMSMNEVAGGSQAGTGYSIGYTGSGAISLTSAATGTINNGATVNNSLTITSAAAGSVSGTFTISNTGNTADTNRAGVNHDVAVNATFVDGSQASFSTSGSSTSTTIDFGTVNQGDVVSPLSFLIANLEATAGFTAGLDILAGDIGGTGDTGVFGIDLAALTNLAAGGSNNYSASFDTSNMGTFTATYTFLGRDTASVQGGLANSSPLTLTITGTVVPTPGSAALIGLGGLMISRRRRA